MIKVGAMATIQDEGRFGYRQYGIPQSGAMDKAALHFANQLLGNGKHFPALEVAMQGLVLKAVEETLISVTGAAVSIKINEEQLPMNQALQLRVGDQVTISSTKKGVYFYLGMAGKIEADMVFESYSTYTMAGFGGTEGRSLKAGDELLSGKPERTRPETAQKLDPPNSNQPIRILKGPEWGMLKDSPDRKTFTVSPSSNRMGVRLEGPTVDIESAEITSSAVIPGTIQLPSNGHPIVLMNDCQTTGGYPRIAKVIEEDMGRLAQKRPAEEIKFTLFENEEI